MGEETDIQNDIMDLLGRHPRVAWVYVTSTGKFKGLKGGGIITIGRPGMPDICGMMKDGRFLGVEVKRPGEVPTADQVYFIDMINMNNGIALWADSIESCDFKLSQLL